MSTLLPQINRYKFCECCGDCNCQKAKFKTHYFEVNFLKIITTLFQIVVEREKELHQNNQKGYILKNTHLNKNSDLIHNILNYDVGSNLFGVEYSYDLENSTYLYFEKQGVILIKVFFDYQIFNL